MDENTPSYNLDLDIEDIHLLYQCVCKRIETWEGYPARHPMEQEHLAYLKNWLYRLILEHKFDSTQ
jgi:hypothetical protein|tara:strand:- start:166 stop:363 length:198 start_codon:yes stop_codon:yes gene_type:complete